MYRQLKVLEDPKDQTGASSDAAAGAFDSVPVFLSHGDGDGTEDLGHGMRMVEALKQLEGDVKWTQFDNSVIHWIKQPEAVDEFVGFLQHTLAAYQRQAPT